MTEAFTTIGDGISSDGPALTLVPDVPEEAYVGRHAAPRAETEAYEGMPAPELVYGEDIISQLRKEMDHKVADVEWRLAQAYEQKLRTLTGGAPVDMVTVEDINDGVHRLTGYTLTNNTPAGGITWASLHVVFKGVDYTIANGSLTSAQKYAWFVKPASGTAATLQVGAAMPTLGPEDALIFVNNNGVGVSALESSVPAALPSGVVTSAALASDVSGLLTQLQNDLLLAQNTADGAVQTYFQNEAPWANGTTQDPAKVGDIWYDADNGGAFRWSGAGGSPVNQWIRIADTDTSALQSRLNTRTTTYVANNTPGPVALEGGFVTGDLWMVTDQGNKFKRWNGTAWADITIGDAALATGISAAKITGTLATGNIPVLDAATKLSGTAPLSVIPTIPLDSKTSGVVPIGQVPTIPLDTKVSGTLPIGNVPTIPLDTKTSGTLQASKVGAGVAGAVLNSATGTVGTNQIAGNAVTSAQIATNAVTNAQIANGSVQPVNINAAFHIVY